VITSVLIFVLPLSILLAVFVMRLLARRPGIKPGLYWLGAAATAILPPIIFLLIGGVANLITYNGICHGWTDSVWECSAREAFTNGVSNASLVAGLLLVMMLPLAALIFGFGWWASKRRSQE